MRQAIETRAPFLVLLLLHLFVSWFLLRGSLLGMPLYTCHQPRNGANQTNSQIQTRSLTSARCWRVVLIWRTQHWREATHLTARYMLSFARLSKVEEIRVGNKGRLTCSEQVRKSRHSVVELQCSFLKRSLSNPWISNDTVALGKLATALYWHSFVGIYTPRRACTSIKQD
jgi:hypothetical protein